MTNFSKTLTSITMLCAVSCTLFMSCKKDVPFNNASAEVSTEATQVEKESIADQQMLTSTYTRKNLLFDYSSEATTALQYYKSPLTSWHNASAFASYSVTRSPVVARSGAYATRFELNKSDGMVASGKRAETYRNPRGEPVIKVERWYGLSYFLPSSFIKDASPESLTQWASNLSTGGPLLSLWSVNGQWRIVQMGKYSTNIGNYEINKWTDFVFHVKWSTGSDGLLEVWKNGVKIISKTGQNMQSDVGMGAYIRTGIYKWQWNTGSKSVTASTKRIVYIDDVRVGNESATYQDVAPGL